MIRYIQVALIGVACFLIGAYINTHMERAVLFKNSGGAGPSPESLGLYSEDVSFLAPDGTQIYGLYIPATRPDPGAPAPVTKKTRVILFCHGVRSDAAGSLDEISLLNAAGADVLVFDYRGYGHSEGDPSEKGTYADAEGAFNYLAGTRGIPPSQIIIFGESLGSGIAVETARRHTPGGLILRSPFTSLPALANWRYPFFLGWLVRDRYDNLSRIGAINCPLLILHSKDDEVVPFYMGKALYDMAHDPKTLVELKGPHHAYRQATETYTSAVAEFLKR